MKLCNGICLTGSDIGLPSNEVAYAHPNCPEHGDSADHAFEYDNTDGHGHEYCKCGGVRETHVGENPCAHLTINNGHCFDCGQRRFNVETSMARFIREDF